MIKLKSLITEYNFKMTKIDIQGNITVLYDLNS
jgi:hypothetical protein